MTRAYSSRNILSYVNDSRNSSPQLPADSALPACKGHQRAELRACILAAGFERAGFARIEEATPGAERFRGWLDRGFAGEMDYLARSAERRLDPRRVLPGARSVIAVALHYRHPGAYGIASPRSDRAEISAYARGTDYHRVLERRLKRACELLQAAAPAAYRWYADTGPVLEKAWAERAGVGWIGKNTCAIDRERGSFFFIGVILTSLEIEPDAPAADHCGSCRLCLDACPTGAIVAPYVLDARRCISYLTIEARGEVPSELEGAMGNLVFGCDICQEVCPFNHPDQAPGDAELAPRPENVFPRLTELGGLSPDTFAARFPRSAVRRARPRGFLRNVLIALGNSGRPEHLRLVEELASRPEVQNDPMLRATAERAAERLAREAAGRAPPRGTMRVESL
jgi:epoxyqueuosine reductase